MVSRFISLLLLPLFTAYLTPADYGVLAMLALLSQIVQPVFTLGLGAGFGPCYFDGSGEAHKARAVWTAFAMLVASTALLVLVAWLLPAPVSQLLFQSARQARLVALTLIGVGINNLSTPFMLRLQFENRAVPFVLLTLASTLATIGSSVVLVIGLHWGVEGMVWGQIAGFAIGTALFLIYAARGMELAIEPGLFRELARLGLPLVPAFASLLVILHGNKYILRWFWGLDSLGVYSIGFNLGMAISMVVGAFQTAWYSYFMAFMQRQEDARVLFGRVLTYYLMGVGGVVLAMFVLARPVVHLMTRPAFFDAYRVVGLVATAQLLMGAFSVLLPGLYFAKKVAYVTGVQFLAALALLAASFALIPPFGAPGAGLALVIGTLSMVLLLAALNRRRSVVTLEVVYEPRRILRFAGAFAVIAGATLLPYPFVWWQQIVIACVGLTAILAAVLGLLTEPERRMLGRFRVRITQHWRERALADA